MPCPVPGMDPFFEGQRWPDFHHRLISAIADALTPALRPRYEARIEERVYVERESDLAIGVVRPDISIVQETPQNGGGMATIAPPARLAIAMPVEHREAFIEIRIVPSGELVTVIEVLSPANKRAGSDGRSEYLRKRQAVLGSRVHLLELDLLRGGQRMPMADPLPPADFYVIASRARTRPVADVWHFALRDPLPVVGVPLAGGDPDLALDLQAEFTSIYDRAGYDYTLRYQQEVAPPLAPEDTEWVRKLLAAREVT